MFCDKCAAELPDEAVFCSSCGANLAAKSKNIYVALVLSFVLTGLGSIYAGNTKKGLALLIIRVLSSVFGVFVNLFIVFSIMVWAYGFYEAYRDVQIANGHYNPKLVNDFRRWNQNNRIIAVLIIGVILIFAVGGCISFLSFNNPSPGDSGTHYHTSGSSGGSSHSSHYGGVDTSPNTIAKNDPASYYDYYEYGDNPDIDDYLESEGFD